MAGRSSKAGRDMVVFGAGGHATSVCGLAISLGYVPRFMVDPAQPGRSKNGIPIVGSLDGLGNPQAFCYAAAIGDNWVRAKVLSAAIDTYGKLDFPPLVHAAATIGHASKIGEGTVILPQGNVGARSRIGRFCIINTKASIDHDGCMMDFASLGPGVTVGGNVFVGERAALGIGAVARHRISIGEDAIVGASSYVHTDVPAKVVAFGVPARVIRPRQPGESYV